LRNASLAALIEQCRSGLEAERSLLERMQGIAVRQHETTAQVADIVELQRATDQREALTSEWTSIEQQIRPALERLMREQAQARQLPGFSQAIALRQMVAEMVEDILETDHHSLRALEQIVAARRAAAHAAEQAETTLAAYARMATRPPRATLVNSRG
jgi:hypothetical protein